MPSIWEACAERHSSPAPLGNQSKTMDIRWFPPAGAWRGVAREISDRTREIKATRRFELTRLLPFMNILGWPFRPPS